jgi:hypothetical protein
VKRPFWMRLATLVAAAAFGAAAASWVVGKLREEATPRGQREVARMAGQVPYPAPPNRAPRA